METRSFQHLNPVWRDKANFIIGAPVPPLKKNPKEKVWEQLWARKIDDNHFEICCIPLFCYGLALGDEVETDQGFMIVIVTHKSGHDTMRIWFNENTSQEKKDELTNEILVLDCLIEWYSQNFLGVDSDSHAKT